IHVAAGRMDEVVAADGEQIAIAGIHHHLQFGIGELESGGKRDRPAVCGVKAIEIGVAGDTAGAADAGDHGNLIEIELGTLQRAGEAVDGGADAAGRTPDVRHTVHAQVRLYGVDRV